MCKIVFENHTNLVKIVHRRINFHSTGNIYHSLRSSDFADGQLKDGYTDTTLQLFLAPLTVLNHVVIGLERLGDVIIMQEYAYFT